MNTNLRTLAPPRGQRGFSLIELMFADPGLLVVGGASACSCPTSGHTTRRRIWAASRKTPGSPSNSGPRGARSRRHPRAREPAVANVTQRRRYDWWNNWGRGVSVSKTAHWPAACRAPTRSSCSGESTGVSVVDHVTSSAQFKVNTVNTASRTSTSDGVRYSQAVDLPGSQRQRHQRHTMSTTPATSVKRATAQRRGSAVKLHRAQPAAAVQAVCQDSQIVKPRRALVYRCQHQRWTVALPITMRRGCGAAGEEVAEGIQDMQIPTWSAARRPRGGSGWHQLGQRDRGAPSC